MLVTESPTQSASSWHIILEGTEHMHTFYSAQDKILMHACLATFYFNVYFKCPLEVPCLGVFHSLSQPAEDPEWGKIDVTLEPNSGILDHLIKAFIFFGLHPACLFHPNAGTNGSILY